MTLKISLFVHFSVHKMLSPKPEPKPQHLMICFICFHVCCFTVVKKLPWWCAFLFAKKYIKHFYRLLYNHTKSVNFVMKSFTLLTLPLQHFFQSLTLQCLSWCAEGLTYLHIWQALYNPSSNLQTAHPNFCSTFIALATLVNYAKKCQHTGITTW